MGLPLRFEVLGALRAWAEGDEIALGGRKQKAVLAALLLEADRFVSRDSLVEAVWGENREDSAVRTLQVYVSNLRRALRPDLIASRSAGYSLQLGSDAFDLAEFSTCQEQVKNSVGAGRYAEAVEAARRGLDLFQGPPLVEFAEVTYFLPEAARLIDAQLALRIALHEAELMTDREPAAMIPDLEHAAAANPLNEHLHALLMTGLYRAGRQADALAVYTTLRSRLVDQLGLDLSAGLHDLERRILEQDQSLMSRHGALDATKTVSLGTASDLPTAHLEADDGTRLPLVALVTTIGRLPDRSIVLSDASVSRRHAEVRRSPTGFLLVDCGATNGVTVNGSPVAQVTLDDGDSIGIGNLTLRFVADA